MNFDQRSISFVWLFVRSSVSVKLIPLLFLPLFFQWFVKNGNNKSGFYIKSYVNLGLFYLICLTSIVVLFLPFYSSELMANYANSVGLWFRNFEFNASFYYIFREIGYWFRGYNEIAIIGKISPILTILFLIFLTFFRKNITTISVITAMLFGLCFYYFTATTVHPWYLATPLILSVFTKYKFPLVWSCAIILSYLAYINLNKADKSENLWVIALEYTIVYGVFIWEVYIKNTPEMESK